MFYDSIHVDAAPAAEQQRFLRDADADLRFTRFVAE